MPEINNRSWMSEILKVVRLAETTETQGAEVPKDSMAPRDSVEELEEAQVTFGDGDVVTGDPVAELRRLYHEDPAGLAALLAQQADQDPDLFRTNMFRLYQVIGRASAAEGPDAAAKKFVNEVMRLGGAAGDLVKRELRDLLSYPVQLARVRGYDFAVAGWQRLQHDLDQAVTDPAAGAFLGTARQDPHAAAKELARLSEQGPEETFVQQMRIVRDRLLLGNVGPDGLALLRHIEALPGAARLKAAVCRQLFLRWEENNQTWIAHDVMRLATRLLDEPGVASMLTDEVDTSKGMDERISTIADGPGAHGVSSLDGLAGVPLNEEDFRRFMSKLYSLDPELCGRLLGRLVTNATRNPDDARAAGFFVGLVIDTIKHAGGNAGASAKFTMSMVSTVQIVLRGSKYTPYVVAARSLAVLLDAVVEKAQEDEAAAARYLAASLKKELESYITALLPDERANKIVRDQLRNGINDAKP